MSNKLPFPDWFIKEIVNIEDKQKAIDRTLSSRETIQFKCSKGHLFLRRVDNYICLSSMKKKTECPICNKKKGRKYSDAFINALCDSDREKALEGSLTSTDRVTLICNKGHITSSLVCSKVDLTTGDLKSCLCSECAKEINKEIQKENNKHVFPQWFIDSLLNEDDKQKAREGTLCSEEPLYFKCPKGHITKGTLYNKIRVSDMTPKNSICSICAKEEMRKKRSDTIKKKWVFPTWFIDELVNEEDKEKARKHTLCGMEEVEFCCPNGHHYRKKVNQRINMDGTSNYGCEKCFRDCQSIRLTPYFEYPKWFIDELVDKEDVRLAILGKLPVSKKVRIKCPVCGNIYTRHVRLEINVRTKERRKLCNKCRLNNNKNIPLENRSDYPDWFINMLVDEDDKQKAIEKRLRVNEIVRFKCTKGHVFTAPMYSRLKLSTGERRKIGCKACAKNVIQIKREKSMSLKRIYPNWFINELYLEEDKERARNKTLKVNDTVQFICPVGHVYTQIVSGHIKVSTGERRKGCNICFYQNLRSQVEIEIEQYIKDLGFSTEHTYFKSKDRKFEIDIYIPEKKIGIEYNGSYFHKTLPKDKNSKEKFYHNNKYYACKDLGIRLVSIFEPDWSMRKEKVQQYLSDLLLPTKEKVYARNTKILPIDSHTANLMYEDYHLLGKTTVQQVSYGLMYNGQLISCMSFQKGRYKDNNEATWCLTRFVTKSDYVVIGGASKLLNQFEKDYNPSVIISYSDNDYFDGNVYNKLGFTCMGDTKSPRYFWWLENTEYKREVCQLKNLAKKYPDLYEESKQVAGNKEDYIMLSLGAYKVYRSGHTKWVKVYKSGYTK